jgi:hypothetical protein
MASNGPFNKLQRLLQYMSAEQLLDEVFQGLSDTEAYDILEHIERMWDLSEDDEEEEEDQEEEEESADDEDDDSIDEDGYDRGCQEEVEDQSDNVVNKVLAFRRKE